MKQLCVTIHVNPAAAARAGRVFVGDNVLTLTEQDLGAMTDDERGALAAHLEHETGWAEKLGVLPGEEVSEASVETLVHILRLRIARASQRAKEAKQRHSEARAAVAEAIKLAASCPVEALWCDPDECRALKPAWSFGVPAAELESKLSAAALAEREDEAYQYAVEVHARRDREAEERRQQQAERAMEKAREEKAGRDAVRAFAEAWEPWGDDTEGTYTTETLAWLDQLDDVRLARKYVSDCLWSMLAQDEDPKEREVVLQHLPRDWRIGERADEPVADINVYREMNAVRNFAEKTLERFLAHSPGRHAVTAEVSNPLVWRPATPDDDAMIVDSDAEVLEEHWIRLRFDVGPISVSFYKANHD